MIPLRDANRSSTIPVVTYLLIAANVVVFFFETSLGARADAFIFHFGVVPLRFFDDITSADIHLRTFSPFFTSMFLHGGWGHLLGNMWFLHIFGDNVEDKFGHVRYLFFYLAAGLGAAATQTFINTGSEIPMVGASGAIAGVLGAYVFMFPTAKIATLVPVFMFWVIELPAFLFLGIWFFVQIMSGLMSLGIGGDAGGVAWWAHIGGFAVGVVSVPFLRKFRV
jgi:hypothetical protein